MKNWRTQLEGKLTFWDIGTVYEWNLDIQSVIRSWDETF